MRRKAPRVGDLVSAMPGRSPSSAPGLVVRTVGIHLYVRLLKVPWEGHSGTEYVRRDSVEVIARAEHA